MEKVAINAKGREVNSFIRVRLRYFAAPILSLVIASKHINGSRPRVEVARFLSPEHGPIKPRFSQRASRFSTRKSHAGAPRKWNR